MGRTRWRAGPGRQLGSAERACGQRAGCAARRPRAARPPPPDPAPALPVAAVAQALAQPPAAQAHSAVHTNVSVMTPGRSGPAHRQGEKEARPACSGGADGSGGVAADAKRAPGWPGRPAATGSAPPGALPRPGRFAAAAAGATCSPIKAAGSAGPASPCAPAVASVNALAGRPAMYFLRQPHCREQRGAA